jgi:hypothetical protein
MTPRRTLAAFAVASLLLVPGLGHAAIVEKWHETGSPDYFLLADAGDVNEDGIYDLITMEITGGTHLGIRNAATGAIEVQSSQSVTATSVQIVDIDADGKPEIIFYDTVAQKMTCFTFTKAPVALTFRWAYTPAAIAVQPNGWDYIDFDGNGQLYMMYRDNAVNNPNYYAYDHNGVLFTQFNPAEPSGYVEEWHHISDYDNDGRQELLIQFKDTSIPSSQERRLFMFENNSPVAVEASPDAPRALSLGASFPNPSLSQSRIDYTVPTTGPASLRIYDVSGREVRSLVDGVTKAGRYQAVWDGQDGNGHHMPAGTYFYDLNTGGQHVGRRMIRLQ